MSKQDRTHSRTPADTENKFLHNLGKRFAEIMGVATDARRTAEGTRSELSKSVAEINKELTDKTAAIELQAKTITKQGENIAELQEKATEQGASIGLLVNNDGVKGSVIVEAINGQSSAKISADKLDIYGDTLNIKVKATNVEGLLNVDGKIEADKIDANGLEVLEATIGEWTLGKTNINTSPPEILENEYALYSKLLTGTITDNGEEKMCTYRVYLTPKGVYVDGQCEAPDGTGISYFGNKTWIEIVGGKLWN